MATGPAPRSLDRAACKGADPAIFDAVAGEDVFDALSYCDRCTVTQACHDWVMPARSYFDGVAAGSLWRNGVQADPGLFHLEGD